MENYSSLGTWEANRIEGQMGAEKSRVLVSTNIAEMTNEEFESNMKKTCSNWKRHQLDLRRMKNNSNLKSG